MLLWLVVWTLVGWLVSTSIIWQLAGREIITVNAISLSRRIEIFGVGFTRSYTLSEIRELRATPCVNPRDSRHKALLPWHSGEGAGAITFDYGARTHRLAAGLDEADAKLLVADLMRRAKVQQTSASML